MHGSAIMVFLFMSGLDGMGVLEWLMSVRIISSFFCRWWCDGVIVSSFQNGNME